MEKLEEMLARKEAELRNLRKNFEVSCAVFNEVQKHLMEDISTLEKYIRRDI